MLLENIVLNMQRFEIAASRPRAAGVVAVDTEPASIFAALLLMTIIQIIVIF